MIKLVAIVGPTAVGKSVLAVRLARTFNGEIVSADSRQIYRYMDIGTAKPGVEERALVPHHLIDILDPDQEFSVAMFQEIACHAIEDIQQRRRQAFLVGGSGLYVRVVTGGFRIPHVPPDPEFRHKMEDIAEIEGTDALYGELQRLDHEAAQRIDPRNVRRVIRALEVCYKTGMPFSKLQRQKPRFDTLIIGLTTSRQDLYRRIDARVDDMIEHGLVQEMQSLAERGYSLDMPSLSGLGYNEIGRYLRGEISLIEAMQHIKHETHRFARHQYAWFRLDDPGIQWFDVRNAMDEPIHSLVHTFLESMPQ